MNKTRLQFFLPSLLGVLLFLTPIPWEGSRTIIVGILVAWIKDLMGDYGLHIVIGILLLTCVLTIMGTVFRSDRIHRHARLKGLFDVPLIWLFLRLTGLGFGLVYFFQIGPELLTSDKIGGAVFVDIGVNVIAVWAVSCLLLPLLTDFGFMEFAGTMARPIFRTIFQLPGRAAIDAVTSFVGASSIGVLITIGQYDRNNYTARQASVIATNFSVVSIPFCIVVASVSGIGHLFISWYGFVVLACLTAAVITPRLPPLSRKANTYQSGEPERPVRGQNDSRPLLREAWERGMERAASAPGVREFFVSGLTNMMFFAFSVMAAAMALATMAALITFHTPVFYWLSYPFVAVLEIARMPDAAAAAPALFSGFLDQYMPAIIAKGIDSEVTSFVLAGLSVCQLIFMSELGVIILRSSLPLSLWELAQIFLLRTVIVLPVLILGAGFVVG